MGEDLITKSYLSVRGLFAYLCLIVRIFDFFSHLATMLNSTEKKPGDKVQTGTNFSVFDSSV